MEKTIDQQNTKKMSQDYKTEIPNEMIEEQTKKIPNLVFLGLAGLGIIGSAALTFGTNRKTLGNFVGLWVPTVMILGLYNKIVKLEDELLNKNKLLH